MEYYVINISSYAGTCPDATHCYGKLYSGSDRIPIEETGEWSLSSYDFIEELQYEMTKEEAIKLDNLSYDRTRTYEKLWEYGTKTTERFNTIEDVIKAGVLRCQELGHEGKIAVLFEGDMYQIINIKKQNKIWKQKIK